MKDPAKNTLMRYAYAYDAAGNITVKNTEHGNYAYGYDGLDRLTSAAYPTSSETFAYDKVGNRTAHNGGSPWTYNANNALTARPAITYQYDANGSQIKKTEGTTVTDYIYNGENRLTQIKQGATTLASYAYDPFGRRINKTVNGTTTYYFYNDEGLTAEANSTGTITQSYGYTPNSTWGTDPLYMRVNGTYHYYLNDHLGTPQQLAMKNGAKTWSAIYEAFGKATVTSSTITNNLRFPGQYADSETGLHYNWNRMYDNQIGRYTKVDPIGLRGGINSYSYGLNNPNKYIDPNGEFLNPWGAAGAALLEIGSQVLIQYVQYNGRYDCIDIDWSDVGIAFIGGALFPGAGKAITDVIYPGKIRKARKVLKYQLKRTKAESRKVKLKNRIKYHESIISNVVGGAVAGQIIVRGSKYLLDDPSQNQKKTGCSCDN